VEERLLEVEHGIDQFTYRSRLRLINTQGLERASELVWDVATIMEIQILQFVQHRVQAVQSQGRGVIRLPAWINCHQMNLVRTSGAFPNRRTEALTKGCTATDVSRVPGLGTCLTERDLVVRPGTVSRILSLVPLVYGAAPGKAHGLCSGVGR
jgi:hypothetical protein